MRRLLTYLLCCLPVLLTGCDWLQGDKTKWNVTLKNNDKQPYGSYLAYKSLSYYFPDAEIKELSRWYRYQNINHGMTYNYEGASLLVMLGLDLYLNDMELKQLLRFAEEGNEIMIFSSILDNKLQERLRCDKIISGREEIKLTKYYNGKDNINALRIKGSNARFGYQGRTLQSYFTINARDSISGDSIIYANEKGVYDDIHINYRPDTLGFVNNNPDFIRYSVGEGHITLHAAPLVMSNYFLLKEKNRPYMDAIWNSLPANITHIYWNEYFRHTNGNSEFGILWKYPATKWALILAIITLLLYVLFESKRRQRIIPIITPPENASVSFVETVGRLYYNKGNHHNLAGKMIQHFLEWVRTHYYLNTNELNEAFTAQLIIKSGLPESVVQDLIQMIHEVRMREVAVDEAYLYHLHQTIERFYKSHTS